MFIVVFILLDDIVNLLKLSLCDRQIKNVNVYKHWINVFLVIVDHILTLFDEKNKMNHH